MNQKFVTKACEIIKAGGVIFYPTEGVYGIGCDPKNSKAIEKLITLKQRDPNKGIILVASDFYMLEEFIQPLPKKVLKRILRSWPGPVSWVVPATEQCSTLLTGNRKTLAIRVSSHPFVQALCTRLGHAVTSTSANISGHSPASDTRKLEIDVDYIVPLPLGKLGGPTPLYDALSGKQLR